jgi:extensin-like protein
MPCTPARATALVLALGTVTFGAPSSAEPDKPPAYPLDAISRSVPARGTLECPKVDLVDHRGENIKYSPLQTLVAAPFGERLKKLERVISEVGVEMFGRAPSRIVHAGTYTCRRMAAHNEFLSEHALGNAIDIEGFDFDALPKDKTLPPGVPAEFKSAFQVRVLKHWSSTVGNDATRARFLKTLVQRVINRDDVIRVALGPGYPNHKSHFHFDMAPFCLVQIFDHGTAMQATKAHECR